MAKSLLGAKSSSTGTVVPAGATEYYAPYGPVEDDNNTLTSCWRVPVDGVIRNLQMQIIDNTLSGTITAHFISHRNAPEILASSATQSAGTDGWVEDTTNAYSVMAGDFYNLTTVAASGSGSCAIIALLFEFEPDDSSQCVTLLGANSPGSNNTTGDGVTYYWSAWGKRDQSFTESDVAKRLPLAGTANGLWVCTGNTARTTDVVVTLRDDSTDTDAEITFLGTEDNSNVQRFDAVNDVAIAEDSSISIKSVNGSGIDAFNYEKMGFNLVTSTSEHLVVGAQAIVLDVLQNETLYLNMMGQAFGQASETKAQVRIPANSAGTVKKFFIEIATNTLSNTSTLTLRINGVDDETISIGAGVTGYLEVIPSSTTLSAGDLICAELAAPAGGTRIQIKQVGIVYEITGTGGAPPTPMEPAYIQYWGAGNNTAVSTVSVPVNATGTASKFARPGNVLVAHLTVTAFGVTFTPDAGWTTIYSSTTGTPSRHLAYKIAAGDDTDNFDVSWSSIGRNYCRIREYDVLDHPAPFDVYGENALSGTTIACSDSPVAPTTARSMVDIALGTGTRSQWYSDSIGTGLTVPAGYSDIAYNDVGASRPSVTTASLATEDQDPINPTWSTSLVGGSAWASIVVLKVTPSGSGPPPTGLNEMYIAKGGLFVSGVPHVAKGGSFVEPDSAWVVKFSGWVKVYEK